MHKEKLGHKVQVFHRALCLITPIRYVQVQSLQPLLLQQVLEIGFGLMREVSETSYQPTTNPHFH